MKSTRLLGEILVDNGRLTNEQLAKALAEQRNDRRRIGEVLVKMNMVSEDDVAQALCEQYGYPLIDPVRLRPEFDALVMIDPSFALSKRVMPFRCTPSLLECVIADPIDVATTDYMTQIAGRPTTFHVAPVSSLLRAIRRVYSLDPAGTHVVEDELTVPEQAATEREPNAEEQTASSPEEPAMDTEAAVESSNSVAPSPVADLWALKVEEQASDMPLPARQSESDIEIIQARPEPFEEETAPSAAKAYRGTDRDFLLDMVRETDETDDDRTAGLVWQSK